MEVLSRFPMVQQNKRPLIAEPPSTLTKKKLCLLFVNYYFLFFVFYNKNGLKLCFLRRVNYFGYWARGPKLLIRRGKRAYVWPASRGAHHPLRARRSSYTTSPLLYKTWRGTPNPDLSNTGGRTSHCERTFADYLNPLLRHPHLRTPIPKITTGNKWCECACLCLCACVCVCEGGLLLGRK